MVFNVESSDESEIGLGFESNNIPEVKLKKFVLRSSQNSHFPEFQLDPKEKLTLGRSDFLDLSLDVLHISGKHMDILAKENSLHITCSGTNKMAYKRKNSETGKFHEISKGKTISSLRVGDTISFPLQLVQIYQNFIIRCI